ncbi:MAG TPA: membrane protein insertase YidC, partial [Kofleriaceae bacterium]|nr:membrane protein insertase YidC [Kofleriaceae bacterium]
QWLMPHPKKAATSDQTTTGQPTQVPSQASPVGQAQPDAEQPAAPGSPAPGSPAPGSPVAPTPPTLAVPPATPPAAEQTVTLKSKAVDVTFSNLGGVVTEWRRRYDPFKGRDMDEDEFLADRPGMGLVSTNFLASTHVIPLAAPWTLTKQTDSSVEYTYRDDVLEIVKSYTLHPDDYLLSIHIDVRAVTGEVKQQLAVSVFSTGDGVRAPLWRAACHLNGTAASVTAGYLVGHRLLPDAGRVKFVGLARKYDLIALSPREGGTVPMNCFRSPIEGVPGGSQVDLVYPESRFSAADKGSISRDLVLYVGPKYFDRLEGADKIAGWTTGFKDVISLGWFSFIARPMLWLLHVLYNLIGNWGLAIIVLTILVKLATLYWTTKSMRSMKAMAALKPEMEAIQKAYPDDRQKQQQAQMELFKQHGVSPLAGCLPMLLQMPIWIALYRMLSKAGELHQATFIPGWLDDLTLPDPYHILPLTLMAMMFLQSKLQPQTGDSSQQKILMYGMPLMFGGMSLFFPAGLTVYIFTNTTLGIFHSLYMNRTTPAKLAAQKAAAQARIAAAARVEKEARVPAEVKRAKPVVAEVSDDDGDDGDDDSGRRNDNSKGNGAGGNRRRGQRRGKRRG